VPALTSSHDPTHALSRLARQRWRGWVEVRGVLAA